MKKTIIPLILFLIFICSCRSYNLEDTQKHNYTTSGALSDDCFQVIITARPEGNLKTMADQRENAFIKAKASIVPETEKQIMTYYTSNKTMAIENLQQENINMLKKRASEYSKSGIIEQEYYLIDNSAVLVYRIFKKGIKNEILNN